MLGVRLSSRLDRDSEQRSFCRSYDLVSTRSLDHLIRSRQHFGRYDHVESLRRLEIHDELKLTRLLDRNIGGLGAFEYLVDHDRDALEGLDLIGAVGHQIAVLDKIFA